MESSFFRQTNFRRSIIPDPPLHRLTESMTRELSVVVTSMLPALLTDSWLASQADRRQKQRARKTRRPLPRHWSLHLTRRPRRGEAESWRAELSIADRVFCGTRADCLARVLRSSSARLRSIKGTERCERPRGHSSVAASSRDGWPHGLFPLTTFASSSWVAYLFLVRW